MKRKNATRSALFTSIISLLLCVSMLVGTTFAWFTDSVQSGINTIAAGNLDVELYHSDKDEAREKVTSITKLFDDVTLWEPGAVAYENFEVENAGNLALKYELSINFQNEVKIGGHGLSEVLKVAVVEGGFEGGRADAQALTNLDGIKNFTLTGALEGEQKSQVYGIVIYWEPTENDNWFNMKDVEKNEDGSAKTPLTIDLGVNLFATQKTYEEDSFGPEYDGGAGWTGGLDYSWYDPEATDLTINSAEQLAAFAAIVNGTAKSPVTLYADAEETFQDSFAGKTVKLVSNIDLENKAWTAIGTDYPFEGTFDGQDYTISNLMVSGTEYLGLFGWVKTTDAEKKATVQNLNVNNASVQLVGDCAGAVIAYAQDKVVVSNVHVTGNVVVVAKSNVGGIVGYGNFIAIDNSSVIAAEGSKIVATAGSYVGGIVGYHNNGTYSIYDCAVENLTITGMGAVGGIMGNVGMSNTIEKCSVKNVVLSLSSTGKNPSVGIFGGCYTYGANANLVITLKDNTAENVTLNGEAKYFAPYDVLHGSEYNGKTITNFVLESNNLTNITNNVKMAGTVVFADDSDEKLEIGENVDVTFDLAGNAVTNQLVNSGKIEVTNGKIDSEIIPVYNYGEATFENVEMDIVAESDGRYWYGVYTQGSNAVTNLNNVNVNVENGGGLYALDGAKVVFNSGSVTITSTETGQRYVVYAYGEGTEVEINGGNFSFTQLYNKRGYVYAGGGATVTINGGEFGEASKHSKDPTAPLIGNVVVKGGTFGFDPTEWVAENYKAMKVGSNWVVVAEEVDAVVSGNEALSDAIAGGSDNVVLNEGTYTLPATTNKEITISGTAETVIDLSSGAHQAYGMSYVFDGVTIQGASSNYKGITHATSVTYKNCTLTGIQFLYADNVVFENCKFDSLNQEHSIWTYGADTISFIDCDFTYSDRAVNVYLDNGTGAQTVSFEGCTFNASNTASKGAVEINSAAFPEGVEVSFTDCTAPAYGTMVGISGWDNTNGATATVKVDNTVITATQWEK